MRCRIPGRKQTTAQPDKRIQVLFLSNGVCDCVLAKQDHIDFAAMCEQSYAVRVYRSDYPLKFYEPRVQTPVDQLVPVGADWRRQFTSSESANADGIDSRREFARISRPLNFNQLLNR